MWQDLQDSIVYVAGAGIAWELAFAIAGALCMAIMRIANDFIRVVMRWE